MKLSVKILMLFCLFSATSCYYPSEEDLFVNGKHELVIESKITNNGDNFVKISTTVDGNSDKNYEPVNDAKVIITNTTTNEKELLTLNSDGLYKLNTMQTPTNNTYNLSVIFNGMEFSATETMPKKPNIQLLGIVYKDSIETEYPGIYLYFVLKKNLDKIGFYKIEVSVNDTLKNKYTDLLLFDDRMYGKNQIIKLPYIFKDKDHVKVEFLLINEVIYNYFYDLNMQTGNLFSNITPPMINPHNNIIPNVLGCFNVASSYKLDTIIKKKIIK